MELKEFVKETLLQITQGVKEAQEECKELGGWVNPLLKAPRKMEGKGFEMDNEHYPVTIVEFKVGLTENIGTENKKGIGVFLPSISLGAAQTKDNNHQSVTSIEFSVPVVLPFIGREGKYINLGSVLY